MGKKIFKEILYFLGFCLASVPMAFIFLSLLKIASQNNHINDFEKVFVVELFIIAFFISLATCYLMRLMFVGLKKILLG
ncbi:MAG: hypothetical protein CNE98_01500 [Bacteroidetes bacterium MED-G17]|nr:MAG: hypothetical protein CNE98_01500 [Bacteroidetes bacterium MED-G17]CAI8349125.1 MAG: Uncharacterised protein [Bacteroidetes bacterium MED-G17]|tara:strand:+ start:20630 stop:20866 length:237 start_codon:yes stop_codon:yes gene_type:complete